MNLKQLYETEAFVGEDMESFEKRKRFEFVFERRKQVPQPIKPVEEKKIDSPEPTREDLKKILIANNIEFKNNAPTAKLKELLMKI